MASLLPAQTPALTGFSAGEAAAQFEREKRFDAALRRENIRQWIQRLSAKPHHLGSPAGKEVADFVAAQFRSWGYDTTIETFYPLFPTPKLRKLEMTAPERYVAKLEEPVLAEDATSGVRENQLPVYNAYSADGDVTGQLVYVNYGLPSDYDALAQHGTDVKGKIVIARYGQSWRGIKPKVAAETNDLRGRREAIKASRGDVSELCGLTVGKVARIEMKGGTEAEVASVSDALTKLESRGQA